MLSKEQIDFYDDNGFVVLIGLFAPDELRALQDDAVVLRSDQRGHPDANVMEKDGKTVGLSTYTAYSFNERAMLSLGCVDLAACPLGSEVTIVWGEEDAGRKPTSEPHVQTRIRATVAPVPYGEVARTAYRPAKCR